MQVGFKTVTRQTPPLFLLLPRFLLVAETPELESLQRAESAVKEGTGRLEVSFRTFACPLSVFVCRSVFWVLSAKFQNFQPAPGGFSVQFWLKIT